MATTDIITAFKALPLEQQTSTYQHITAAFSAAKDARRMELEAEIRQLGFRPGDAAKKPPAAVKYRSRKDTTKTWAGRGAEPTWLKTEMAESGLKLEDYRAT